MTDRLLAKFDNMMQRDWLFPTVLARARREVVLSNSLRASFEALTLVSKRELQPWIGKTDPSYKQTKRQRLDWRKRSTPLSRCR